MSTPAKKPFRKRRLFPRSVSEVVNEATKPLMSKQGKLYGALLRDWAQIVGEERARVTRPERLQFPTTENASGAVLHLAARPAAAPELAYATEQMLEQCARYFGYRAITRIILHATHDAFTDTPEDVSAAPPQYSESPAINTAFPEQLSKEMRAVFERLATHVASASDKKK